MENQEVLDLLDALYAMTTEAWSVPLGNEKCIMERDKVLAILDEIKAKLPAELAEARRIVAVRDEYVGTARRESETIRRSAEVQAKELVDQQEIVRAAKKRSEELLTAAENRTRELYRVANAYVDETLRRTEESIAAAMKEVQSSRAALRQATSQSEAFAAPRPEVIVDEDVK